MLKTTETLLTGLAANNQSRWARFYRDYAPWIENVLCAKGISSHDAEDIIHETLIELVRIMPTYKYDPYSLPPSRQLRSSSGELRNRHGLKSPRMPQMSSHWMVDTISSGDSMSNLSQCSAKPQNLP